MEGGAKGPSSDERVLWAAMGGARGPSGDERALWAVPQALRVMRRRYGRCQGPFG